AEHHDLDLRLAVFQCEVEMSSVPQAAVRDLALDPDVAEPGLERAADRRGQLRDRENVALGDAGLPVPEILVRGIRGLWIAGRGIFDLWIVDPRIFDLWIFLERLREQV